MTVSVGAGGALPRCAQCQELIPLPYASAEVIDGQAYCPACVDPDVHDDPVNSPSHYTAGGIECIDAIEAALSPEAFAGYCRGNSIKYLWRAGLKDPAKLKQDLEKAAWYNQRAISRL